MKIHLKTFLLAALVAVVALQCRPKEEVPEDLVAQVNDRYLRLKEVQENVPEGLAADMALSLKKNLISKWVESEALYQMALEEGIKLDDYQTFLVNEYRKALIIQNLIEQKLNKNYTVSQSEIETYYKNHQDEFRRAEDEMHLVHLFMDQYDQAIFKEIKRSNDLMSIIKKYYFDEKSSIEQPNGDLGYVPVSQIPQKFVRTLRRMKTGKISKPLKFGEGYHFFQLLDLKKKGSVRSLELVRDEIVLRLKKQQREKTYNALVQEAQQKVQIQTYLSKIQ